MSDRAKTVDAIVSCCWLLPNFASSDKAVAALGEDYEREPGHAC